MLEQLLQPSFYLKLIVSSAVFLYVIFAAVVVNQVRVLNRIETVPPAGAILFAVALLHLLLAISLLLLALAIL
ncbi:MAG: hypothetical protein HY429_00795 [Candidatus Levybacteria bacterium]|nr:hypothetical protein [Candidatus Levybacteria bacterium]